jgi:tetratricopeptide (TPR) repeat protein
MRRLFLVSAWLFLASLLPGLLAAQDVKTHVDQGIANCEAGKFDQAMKDFNAGLKMKPKDPALYDYRGMVYRCKGQNDKAIQDFNKAMELDPKFARAYRNRGMVYFDLGEFDKALTDLKKAQSLGHKIDEDFLKMVARKAAEKK